MKLEADLEVLWDCALLAFPRGNLWSLRLQNVNLANVAEDALLLPSSLASTQLHQQTTFVPQDPGSLQVYQVPMGMLCISHVPVVLCLFFLMATSFNLTFTKVPHYSPLALTKESS